MKKVSYLGFSDGAIHRSLDSVYVDRPREFLGDRRFDGEQKKEIEDEFFHNATGPCR